MGVARVAAVAVRVSCVFEVNALGWLLLRGSRTVGAAPVVLLGASGGGIVPVVGRGVMLGRVEGRAGGLRVGVGMGVGVVLGGAATRLRLPAVLGGMMPCVAGLLGTTVRRLRIVIVMSLALGLETDPEQVVPEADLMWRCQGMD